MIYYKTSDEVELIRKSSLLVGKTLAAVAAAIKPGMTTLELDTLAETVIRDHGAVPSFKGYNGFPGTLCVSVNEQVVHGIPGNRVIQDGDVVSVDCGAFMNGFHGDSAYSFLVEMYRQQRSGWRRLPKSLCISVSGRRWLVTASAISVMPFSPIVKHNWVMVW